MHHSQLIAAAARNLGAGIVSLHRDPLELAAWELEAGPELLDAAKQVVAAQLSESRGVTIAAADWTAGLAGMESMQIAGLLGVISHLNQPKELTS